MYCLELFKIHRRYIHKMTDLRIIFLGTSAAIPTLRRGLSSVVLARGSELLLFDVGEGMQQNFMKARLGMNRKMKIFVTHMHADHCVGLLGLYRRCPSRVEKDRS